MPNQYEGRRELFRGRGDPIVDSFRSDPAAVREFVGVAPARALGDAEDDEIDALVDERLAARAAKDFGRADRIRDELAARGIVLEDSARGTSWHRG